MEGPRELNWKHEGLESWLELFGLAWKSILEKVDAGIQNNRPRILFMVSLSRRLLTEEEYNDYKEAAWHGNEKVLYDLLASISLRGDKEWTFQDEQREVMNVPEWSKHPTTERPEAQPQA